MDKENNTKFVKKYEWMGDVKSYKEPQDNEHSNKYNEPDREYLQMNLELKMMAHFVNQGMFQYLL